MESDQEDDVPFFFTISKNQNFVSDKFSHYFFKNFQKKFRRLICGGGRRVLRSAPKSAASKSPQSPHKILFKKIMMLMKNLILMINFLKRKTLSVWKKASRLKKKKLRILNFSNFQKNQNLNF